MKIWVPGCKGLLGHYVIKVLSKYHKVLGTDMEVDVRNPLDKFLKKINPEVVIYCAAYKDVDQCEENSSIAYGVNHRGIENIFQSKPDVLMIYPSTASVFYDKKIYKENDKCRAIGVYAQSKHRGELSAGFFSRHYIVRLSNLYGWWSKNFGTQIYSSARKFTDRCKVVTDMQCQPTNANDVADYIKTLIDKKPPYGIYHCATPEKITRKQFAEKLCKILGVGKPYPFEYVKLSDLNLPAKRPMHSILDCSKWEKKVGRLKTHEEGIERFINEAMC